MNQNEAKKVAYRGAIKEVINEIELAKSFGVPTKCILSALQSVGITYKNERSLLTAMAHFRRQRESASTTPAVFCETSISGKALAQTHNKLAYYVYVNRVALSEMAKENNVYKVWRVVASEHAPALGYPASEGMTRKETRNAVNRLAYWLKIFSDDDYCKKIEIMIAASGGRLSEVKLKNPFIDTVSAQPKPTESRADANKSGSPAASNSPGTPTVKSVPRTSMDFHRHPMRSKLETTECPDEFKKIVLEIIGLAESELNPKSKSQDDKGNIKALVLYANNKVSAERAIGWIPGIRDYNLRRETANFIEGLARLSKCKLLKQNR